MIGQEKTNDKDNILYLVIYSVFALLVLFASRNQQKIGKAKQLNFIVIPM